MKKILRSAFLLSLMVLGMNGKAQVSVYSFNQLSGTYNSIPVSGATSTAIAVGTQDDNTYAGLPIGFNFFYNGTTYANFGLNVNGWICLGLSSPLSSYNPISSGSTNDIISAFGRDLQLGPYQSCTVTNGSNVIALTNAIAANFFSIGDTISGTGIPLNSTVTAISAPNMTISSNATSAGTSIYTKGSISYGLSGVSPNQVLTVQWRRCSRWSSSSTGLNDYMNFQIKLYETTNVVEIVYGSTGTNNANTATMEVGLRGTSTSDFNNRSVLSGGSWAASSAGAVNSASGYFSSSTSPSSGQIYRWSPPSGCTGAPAANSAVAAQSVVCSNGSANLSLATSYTNTGYTYQWMSSSTGSVGAYSAISGATTSAYTATNITGATWFEAVITCTNGPASTTSTPVQITVGGNACQCTAYCASSATSTFDDEIFNVSIGTLNNSSTCGQTGGPGSVLNKYSNYTGMLAAPNLVGGSNYTLSVTVGMCNSFAYSGVVTAFIDFNQNGSFADPGEQIYVSPYQSFAIGGTAVSTVITIPVGATPGITRMRVIEDETSIAPGPCSSFSWGEVEDYCVNIVAPTPCAGAPSANAVVASPTVVCFGGSSTLSLANSYTLGGLTYQWSTAPSSVGPYTAVSGATLSSFTATNITSATWYQAVITCSAGPASTTATPVQVIMQTPPSYAAVPFLEAFDNVWQNRCDVRNVPVAANWDSSPTTGNNSWRRQNDGSSAAWTNPTFGTVTPIGTGCADFHSISSPASTTGDLDVYLNMSGPGNYVLSFYNFNSTGNDSLLVYFSNNAGSSFSQIGNYNLASSWTKQNITLGSVASPSCIVRFRGVADFGGSDLGVDSVNVFTAVCTSTPFAGTISGPNNVTIGSTNSYSVAGPVGNLQWVQSSSPTGPYSSISGATATPANILASPAGTVYYSVIASNVGCPSFTSSAYAVTVNPMPGDMACSATALTSFTSNSYYYLDNYTSEPNEVMPTGGSCSTNTTWCIASLENSRWFTFVAPPSGNVSIQSPGFDTQLAVWSATACTSLTSSVSPAALIAANDDDANYASHGGVLFSSYVTAMCLTPGTTYYIQLDSYSAASPFDSTKIVITDLGANSFTGLTSNYCLPSGTTATLTPNFAGGYFTMDVATNTITAFTPSVAGAGTHTVSYTYNGCTTNSIVTVGNQPSVTVNAGTGTVCAGGSTGLTASGATSYTWSTGANASAIAVTPSVNTTYTVDGSTGAGCIGSATISIVVNALPSVSLTAAQTTVCTNGPTVALTGSPSGGVYTGSNVAGGVFTPGAVAGTFVPGYNVTSTVTGCSNSASVAIVVSSCTGLNKVVSTSGDLQVYPNPNNGEFTIELKNGSDKMVEITDLTGRIVLSQSSSSDKIDVNINTLANGVYFVKIQSNKHTEMIKVIKQ